MCRGFPHITRRRNEFFHIGPGAAAWDARATEYNRGGVRNDAFADPLTLNLRPGFIGVWTAHYHKVLQAVDARIAVDLPFESVCVAPQTACEERARPLVD